MKCAYAAVRSPFGMSNAALATRMYGGKAWDILKNEQRIEHDLAREGYIAAGGKLGEPVYVEREEAPDYDGRLAEWRSEIIVSAQP